MKTNSWLGVISSIILLLLIISLECSQTFNHFDQKLHKRLLREHDNFFWNIIAFINDPKLMIVWTIFLADFLINEKQIFTALWVLATIGLTDLVGIILKNTIRRQRPIDHSDLEDGYSFPSGHVLGATSMALILLKLYGPKYGNYFIISLIIIWLLIIRSRLKLRAHYPSDIVGATSLAVLCFSITRQIFINFL